MWHVLRRMLNRFLALQFLKVLGWCALRYAAIGILLLLFFILVFAVGKHLGQWGSEVGRALSFVIPLYLLAIPITVFAWAVRAHAIEPAKKSDTLDWSEDEMAPEPIDEPDAEVFELYPEDRDSA